MDFLSGLLLAGLIVIMIWEALKESPEERCVRERKERIAEERERERARKSLEAAKAEAAKRQREKREIDELWRHARDLASGSFPKRVGGNKLSDIYVLTWDHAIEYAPNRRGVYYLIETTGETLRVFYIGQSKSIKTRLLRHLKNAGDWGGFRPMYTYIGANTEQTSKRAKKRPNPGIRKHIRENKCYFMFVGINKLDKRDRVEHEQIAKYKPECNRNHGIIKRKYGEWKSSGTFSA